jgi:pyruvate kinase
LINKATMLNEVIKLARNYVVKNKIAEKGDKIVLALGMPFGKKIDTNMLLVEVI